MYRIPIPTLKLTHRSLSQSPNPIHLCGDELVGWWPPGFGEEVAHPQCLFFFINERNPQQIKSSLNSFLFRLNNTGIQLYYCSIFTMAPPNYTWGAFMCGVCVFSQNWMIYVKSCHLYLRHNPWDGNMQTLNRWGRFWSGPGRVGISSHRKACHCSYDPLVIFGGI